jgi:hypothetical protein
VKIGVRLALIGFSGMTAKVHAQKMNTLESIWPLLKTQVASVDVEKSLLQKGFEMKVVGSTPKEKLFQGYIDSGLVTLSIRKVSKKGPVWGYKLVFASGSDNWMQKKGAFEKRLLSLNAILESSPANTVKTLPQYCKDREAACFRDGIAKYQSSWYWNNAVQRIKTVELAISGNYELTVTMVDNVVGTLNNN